MKYYAVAAGRTTGIFTSWPIAKAQVDGFPGAIYKSFKTREQAEAFLADPVLGTGTKKTGSSRKPRDNGPNGSDADWPDGTIVVYTDGSAIGNPGPGGYGVVIRERPDGPARELSGSYRHTTNNRMEMTAVIKGAPGNRCPRGGALGLPVCGGCLDQRMGQRMGEKRLETVQRPARAEPGPVGTAAAPGSVHGCAVCLGPGPQR